MKYVLLLVFSCISVYLLLRLVYLDFSQLTEYEWGYLTGTVILLLLFIGLSIFTWRTIKKRSKSR